MPDASLASLRISPREPPVAEITRKLLDFLLSGAVAPGAKIPPERQLAEALAVGRSSVREAIKSLSFLGLLDVRQGDGTYLSRSGADLLPEVVEWGLLLGEPSVLDIVEARAELEVVVAGFAAQRADDEGQARLEKCLERMRKAGNRVGAYIEADAAFHLELAQLSGNDTFIRLVSSFSSLLRAWAKRVLVHAGETETSLAVHEPIVLAVRDGDAEAARTAMRNHMDRARRRLETTLQDTGGA